MVSQLLIDVAAGLILMGVSAGGTYVVTTRRLENKSRDEIGELKSILHGHGTSNIMEGLIEIVDQHEGDISSIMSTQEELIEELEENNEKLEELEERVDKIKNSCRERREKE